MKDYLKRIKRQRLFIGSGVDDIVDENLKTELDDLGQYHADYDKTASHQLNKIVLNSDDSRDDSEIGFDIFSEIKNIKHDDRIGYYLDLYVGYTSKGGFRKRGSSGGFVTWLAVRLLERGKIDGLIHVKQVEGSDKLFEYVISRNVSDIKAGSKSRYYPAELSKVLREVKDVAGRYAVVGIPEIITELRLLAENDETIKQRIKYYFGLVAGHQKTTKYAEAIAWEYGIKPGDLQEIDFRHKRKTGKAIEYDMKFTGLVDGRQKTFIVRNNEPFVSSWAHGFFKARFSDFTDNSFNETADITFGDAWLEEYVGDPDGNNILIVRNPEISSLIKDGIKKGEVCLDEVDSETIIRSQQGLIHHTRDELPYRLHKELSRHGWAPKKRVAPSSNLDEHRKKVQDARQNIAEKSHTYYKKAVKLGDFDYFKNKMLPLVNEYKKLYGQPIEGRYETAKADGAILTLTGYFNYGNVVQRYALQQYLKKNGFNFVSYVNSHSETRSAYRIGRMVYLKAPLRFIKRFMNYEKPYWYIPGVADIFPEVRNNANLIEFVNRNIWIKQFNPNDNYRNYIVGSDQTWRNWWNNREILGYYFFNFLKSKKTNRIAYAASFGKDKIEDVMSEEDVEYIRPYIEQFDHVSVREKSGISLIESAWNIENVENVVDPTLLLEQSDYSELIEKTDVKYQSIQPIFTYVLAETSAIKQFIRRVQDEKQQAVSSIRAHAGAENDILPPVEYWLKGFRDADLVITNSFHGMMFSVINNTDFIIIGKEAGGLSRIKDFLEDYGIDGRFVDERDIDTFDTSTLKPINWEAVNKKLKARRKQSGDWLIKSIL